MLGNADLIQTAQGDRVTSRLVYHFQDGSLNDETAVFTQRGHFSLISDHLVQKGPAFTQPLDMTIDRPGGHVVVRYKDEHGADKLDDARMTASAGYGERDAHHAAQERRRGRRAADLVARRGHAEAAAREARDLGGRERSLHGRRIGTGPRGTTWLKVDIGGIAGAIAPLIGKQPPDSHVWIVQGEAPAFVRSQSPMFNGAPLWQTELASPVWPAGGRQ